MVQLPISYYNAELRKEDQDGNLVSDAIFEIEKKILIQVSGFLWNFTTQGLEEQFLRFLQAHTDSIKV